MKIIVCYESKAGGETVATRELIEEFVKNRASCVVSLSTPALTRSDSLHFYLWIICSVVTWISVVSRARKTDWIYTTSYTAGITAVFLKPFRVYKIAWHFHGNRVPPSGKGMRGKIYFTQYLKYYTVFWLHKVFIKYLDIIFVPSEKSKKVLLSQFPIARNKKILIIPNGVNLEKYFPISSKVKQKLRIQYGIPSDFKVLLYVGRLEKLKGIEDLISVFFRLRKKKHKIILILAYPTPQGETEINYIRYLKKKIEKLSLNESVNWIQDHYNLASLYHVSDIVVSLSELEHFPLTMLEAFATKTPYISRGVGVVDDFLSSVDSRLLITSNDNDKNSIKIANILDLASNEIKVIKEKGYERSRQYTWNRSAKMIIAQLDSAQKMK